MYKIKYSPAAMADLEEMYVYLSSEWGERDAVQIIGKITSNIRNLEQFPLLGVSLAKIVGLQTEYRYLFSEKNYVFYRIEMDTIRIIRIINEKQDYIAHLFEG